MQSVSDLHPLDIERSRLAAISEPDFDRPATALGTLSE